MNNVGRTILGGLVTLIGLAALVLAARAQDTAVYLVGLSIFVLSVLFVMLQIKMTFDGEKSKE